MINLSYSRISLADIADKLQLGSPEDAEFIIAKVTFCGKTLIHSHGQCFVSVKAKLMLLVMQELMMKYNIQSSVNWSCCSLSQFCMVMCQECIAI